MKILVLNGSPKKEKSDVMCITRAFLQGMNEFEEQQVEVVHVIEKHVEYCTGCLGCMKNGGTCVHNDDVRPLLDKILACDLLLLSFPLYCYGMPAPLKAFIDRTLPLSSLAMHKVGDRYEHVSQANYSSLKYLMICGCGFPNSRHNFEGVVEQFKLCFPHDHTILTLPESPMFNVPEAQAVTAPKLQQVKEAGKLYAQKGELPQEVIDQIRSPMIPEDVYAQIVNSQM